MDPSRTPTYLRRYTDLPALLHLLRTRQITLLDPKTWDDKNDSYFMSVYKDKKHLQSVLALCFSQTSETYHHWRVFSHGPSGVAIVFDRQSLLDDLHAQPDVFSNSVEYLTLVKARKKSFRVDELPFIKRYGYKPESEFRVVYTSAVEQLPSLSIAMRLSSVRSISLSPWMHSSLQKSVVSLVRSIPGCERLKVSRSTLISNEQWKSFANSAA